jgi:NAD(P)-dependent dehydrogenase (short-subunit alcohol dehydrogenase family)
VALVTGASQGLGLALARRLAEDDWRLVVDARRAELLADALTTLAAERVTAIAGDVADPGHRAELARAVDAAGRLDLLVHNASALGPSPLPALAAYPLDELRRVYEVDVLAPLALTQLMLPTLRRSGGVLVAVSSDAAVEAYEGWGGYGSAKAALDHLMAVLAVENPDLRIYAVDPGDMNTAMHQAAFPGEDITDRPLPETVVPAFLALIGTRPPSGRYRAADLTFVAAGTGA